MEESLNFVANQPTVLAVEQNPPVDFNANLVVVVIPAFNEERFIASVVLKILRFPVKVIVVDDGSSDDTSGIAQAAGATVVRHPVNRGKGQALNTGFTAGRSLNPAAIVVIDADGQHLPEQLVDVVRPVLNGEADIVVGSRYLQPRRGVPAHRVMGHWFFNQTTHMLSGVKVTDSQSGYRAFSPKAYNADLFHSSDFSVESEMQFQAHQYGLRVKEVPITIRYTDKPKRSVWQQGLVVLNGVLRLAGQYRPLMFFGGTGLLVMLAGLGLGVVVVNIYSQVKQLAVGYAILSVLLTIIGMLGLATGIILHSIRGLLSEMLNAHFKKEQEK